jgi:glycosyltransferase involved in cell wall biosynthesis
MAERIDVIIPTRCDLPRRDLLLRAIDCVIGQEGVEARPIVVVNGPRYLPDLVEQLRARTDMALVQIDAPSVFAARRAGFAEVRSEYFAILDDDDLFLPGSLARRLDALRADRSADWVVSNGIFVSPDGLVPYIPDLDAVRRDPYGTLLEYCWLCSAGNLFRTSVFKPDIFDAVRSMEITYIAFRLLAEGRRPVFLDEQTFKYFYYPDSLSKMASYTLLAYETIDTMQRLPLPGWVRSRLAQKYRRAMHDLSDYQHNRGEVRAAWMSHLRSMAGRPECFRYAGFTRKLVRSTLRVALGGSAQVAQPDPVRLPDRP